MITVGAFIAKLDKFTHVRINDKFVRRLPRSVKRLRVRDYWEDYYYDEDWGESRKIMDIWTTKGR